MSAPAVREICRIGGLKTPKLTVAKPALAQMASRHHVKLRRAQLTVLCADLP